ncbi:centrosomal protein 43-like isoform X2 [Mytilus californianus]|uniref:centrosomal protein 43-like isoform X2 n=1 Tax=Mytilus californianus TaxID=6549 RepID=UPI0022473B7B|nr:centrosomal protein 43-like isoform X2 [Mytilus californianus]
MSADEDTELRDLVAQTLETNGVLGKIRAQLRASVFLALEEQESSQNKTPFANHDLRKFLGTKEGKAVAGLIKEFLEFFQLEYTLAVFEPEAGLNIPHESRDTLAKELNVADTGQSAGPLIAELVQQKGPAPRSRTPTHISSEEGQQCIPKDLTSKQLEDAHQKFEFYDKDGNGEIDKDELRDLFIDLFPSFNRNMLDRYVNDEFRAADKNFSSSISFDEFIDMYKRLFLLCRTVVSGEVSDILPQKSSQKSNSISENRSYVDSKNQKNLQNSKQNDMRNGPRFGSDGSDIEEDPFFDDAIPSNKSYNRRHADQEPRGIGRPSQIPVYSNFRSVEQSKSKDTRQNGTKSPGYGTGALSSLQGLPALNQKSPRKSLESDTEENLRAMDRGMADLGLEGDFDYDDDFQSSGHSMSKNSPRTARSEQNGSIVEEIEEEIDDDDVSIEADDLLRSERSGCDDLTTDRTISQHDGFDYMEDVQSP